MSITLTLLAMAAYLAAALGLAQPLFGRELSGPAQRVALSAATAAVMLHAGILFGMYRGAVDLHFFAALSLTACVIATLTLLVNLIRPLPALSVMTYGTAALLAGLDSYAAPVTTPQPMDWQIKLHVTVAMLAYGLLSMAALLALILAGQERALRHHRISPWMRTLPPLTLTETLLFRVIAIGFVLLSITLLSGLLFVDNLLAQHLAHKTILSTVAWLIFGALLLGRWRYGWRGRRAVNLTLIGMGCLLLAFFGSKFVLELVLHR